MADVVDAAKHEVPHREEEDETHLPRRWVTGAPLPGGLKLTDDLTDSKTLMSMPLSIVIFGATGDLAKKKLFPALYQLVMLGYFPRHLHIVGYGRSAVNLPSFISKQTIKLCVWPVYK